MFLPDRETPEKERPFSSTMTLSTSHVEPKQWTSVSAQGTLLSMTEEETATHDGYKTRHHVLPTGSSVHTASVQAPDFRSLTNDSPNLPSRNSHQPSTPNPQLHVPRNRAHHLPIRLIPPRGCVTTSPPNTTFAVISPAELTWSLARIGPTATSSTLSLLSFKTSATPAWVRLRRLGQTKRMNIRMAAAAMDMRAGAGAQLLGAGRN